MLIGKATGTATVLAAAGADHAVRKEGDAVRQERDAALLQFTSGSSGTPKGIRVTWGNLTDNLERIGHAIGWRDGHAIASWLPLHHDMGFIGCMLFPVSAQSELWLLRPDQFIRDPARWLECFDGGQGHAQRRTLVRVRLHGAEGEAGAAGRARPVRLAIGDHRCGAGGRRGAWAGSRR